MAKNLYMFSCPLHSEFDIETRKNEKKIEYVKVIPIEYFKQKPIVETYKTNNPNIFWKSPIDLNE